MFVFQPAGEPLFAAGHFFPDRQPTLPEFQVLSWRDTLAESCLAVNLICIRRDLVRAQAELESLITAAVKIYTTLIDYMVYCLV